MTGIVIIRDLAILMVLAGGAGWLCQRLGLSVVVGYLAAGMAAGPYTPPFQLVADLDRVQILSQIGLVFLIFSIGLNLSFQRLQRLGFGVIVATVVSAMLVFHGCRLLGFALGWTSTQSLFLAGMLMVSSSAIISKILEELSSAHHRFGQLALGVTVLEDVVAVVMLTLLSTLLQFQEPQGASLLKTIGVLGSFVVFLVFISLLFVPRLLLRLARNTSPEVRSLIVIGLLLSLAWLAAAAGYSLALGAFLLGVVVASTPHKPEIERVFEGLRNMFGALFFAAMGMLFDFKLLAENWPLVLLVTAFTLLWRSIACAVGLVLSGNPARESMRAGMALTPLGEFSFIIAQMGVLAKAVPESLYPIAVSASLLTTLLAPSIIGNSFQISAKLDALMPLFLREWITFYHAWLKEIANRQKRSLLWRLIGKRLTQTGLQILFVSALLFFVNPAYHWTAEHLGENWLFPHGTPILFWTAFGFFLLPPLVAIWRNMDAISMILAEFATAGRRRQHALRPLVEASLKAAGTAALLAWLLVLLPFGSSMAWALLAVFGILGALAAVFWRRLVYWHSRLEIELQTQIKNAFGASASDLSLALMEKQADWGLQTDEIHLPPLAACGGKRIAELALRKRFGCSIASIERQGFTINNPSADEPLYPGDKLLLIGRPEQLSEAEQELMKTSNAQATDPISELHLEVICVPQNSPHVGKSLVELDLVRRLGVQIGAIQRDGRRILAPTGAENLEPGDDLLVLGAAKQIQNLREWLNPPPDDTVPPR